MSLDRGSDNGDEDRRVPQRRSPPTTVRESLPLLLERKTWEDFVFRTPCVKSSYLLGLGCGSTMIAHKLHLHRGQVNRAVRAGLFTFIFTSSVSFYLCANEINRKYEMLQKAFQKRNIKEYNKKDE